MTELVEIVSHGRIYAIQHEGRLECLLGRLLSVERDMSRPDVSTGF